MIGHGQQETSISRLVISQTWSRWFLRIIRIFPVSFKYLNLIFEVELSRNWVQLHCHFYHNESCQLLTSVVSKSTEKTFFFHNWCHFIARAIVPHHKHNRRSKERKIFMLLFPLKRFMFFSSLLVSAFALWIRNCRSERSSKKPNIVLCTLTHNFLLPYSFARLEAGKKQKWEASRTAFGEN